MMLGEGRQLWADDERSEEGKAAHLLRTLTVERSEWCEKDDVAYDCSVPRTVASSE